MNLTIVDPSQGEKPHARNPGYPLDLDVIDRIRVNRSALERRANGVAARRVVRREWRSAWLLKAITLMDLTTLNSDDTPGRVARLCAKARAPLRPDILAALGIDARGFHTAAVCVYHQFVETAVQALDGTSIPVAAVSTAFPHGLAPFESRLMEIEGSVKAGASEIDIVIERGLVLTGDWQGLYDQIRAYRKACGDAHLKTILGTGELATLTNVAKASMVAMMAGADFIKTSTGKEKVNATLPVTLAMIRMIRQFHEMTGVRIGYKPAGGISTASQALPYLALIREELGTDWLNPELFRFGASSLLNDLECQLELSATGYNAADYRQAMA